MLRLALTIALLASTGLIAVPAFADSLTVTQNTPPPTPPQSPPGGDRGCDHRTPPVTS